MAEVTVTATSPTTTVIAEVDAATVSGVLASTLVTVAADAAAAAASATAAAVSETNAAASAASAAADLATMDNTLTTAISTATAAAANSALGAASSAVSAAASASTAFAASAAAYSATTTYNYPTVVAYTDGNSYRCVGTSVVGENPDDSSNWVRITSNTNDFFVYDDDGDLMPSNNPTYSKTWELDTNLDIMPQ